MGNIFSHWLSSKSYKLSCFQSELCYTGTECVPDFLRLYVLLISIGSLRPWPHLDMAHVSAHSAHLGYAVWCNKPGLNPHAVSSWPGDMTYVIYELIQCQCKISLRGIHSFKFCCLFLFSPPKKDDKDTNGQSKLTLTVVRDNAPLCVVFKWKIYSPEEKIYKKYAEFRLCVFNNNFLVN